MTGWNLPPGCEVHHLPGNRPIDEAWDEYIDNTDRAEYIFKDLYPEDYHDEWCFDDYYENRGYEQFTVAVDEDFTFWYESLIESIK